MAADQFWTHFITNGEILQYDVHYTTMWAELGAFKANIPQCNAGIHMRESDSDQRVFNDSIASMYIFNQWFCHQQQHVAQFCSSKLCTVIMYKSAEYLEVT